MRHRLTRSIAPLLAAAALAFGLGYASGPEVSGATPAPIPSVQPSPPDPASVVETGTEAPFLLQHTRAEIAPVVDHARIGAAPVESPGRSSGTLSMLGFFAIGMTALTKDRNAAKRDGKLLSYPVGAAKKIYAGSLVVGNAGYAEPGTTALNLVALGRAAEQVDNTGAAGALSVLVERGGAYLFAHDGSITQADVGKTAYIVDDQTVADSDGGGTRSPAGVILGVETDGAWVAIPSVPAPASVTAGMLDGGAGVAALLAEGLGASAAYTKVTDGVQQLLAADAAARVVLILVRVTEAFADAGGSQTTFTIGETDTADKFAAAALFTGAALGEVHALAGTLSATKHLIVTANDAAGAGTGGISVTVLALPAAA